MQEQLMEKAFESQNDNLIAGTRHPLDAKIISVAGGTEYKRGMVLSKAEDGTYFVLGTAEKTGDVSCIVSENLNAKEIASDQYVALEVYISGEFRVSCLITEQSHVITDAEEETLREKGIFVK